MSLPHARPPLTDSARRAFRLLVGEGAMTRPGLGLRLGMSKPTMSAAIAELAGFGLVAPAGHVQGSTGRRAVAYGMGGAAGHVVGLDLGSTQVRAVAQSLDGRILAEAEEALSVAHEHIGEETARALASVRGRLGAGLGAAGPLRAMALAVPAIVSPTRPDLAHGEDRHALDAMAPVLAPFLAGARRLVENNVNCAALAEMHHGAARGRASFTYLQVGVKIGLGIVQAGQLFRGHNGAAGEVARLPFPWAPGASATRNGLEHYLGSQALMGRVAAGWRGEAPAPADPRALFEQAGRGSAEALRLVEAHARDIGRLVAAVVGVLDPGLVVLGGGVGQNPLLLDTVRRTAAELAWPVEIVAGELGSRGTVLGAARLAAAEAMADLVGDGTPA